MTCVYRHWSDAVKVDSDSKNPRESWAKSVLEVEAAVGGSKTVAGKLTAFEAATAAMWVQLRDAQIDVAVIETGLGGRLDATNVCEKVEASVITNIGLDHQVSHQLTSFLRGDRPALLWIGER